MMNVGTIEISSKDSAKRAFKKPPNEKRMDVDTTTNMLNDQLSTVKSQNHNETNVTMAPTINPLATPPNIQPNKIR